MNPQRRDVVTYSYDTDHACTVVCGSLGMAGSADKMLKLYEGHYHDLLNDLGKEEVMADIKGWIEARLPGV